MKKYDVLVIGAGLSGLAAASLLAKRGLKVAVIDKSDNPGGSCGIFKRQGAIFDQGSAMLYGFGENGFNAHRFVFNCLEEPIDMIKHDLLYCVNFDGHRIHFWPDLDRFAEELSQVFPSERDNIRRFYQDMNLIYQHVMVERPSYTTADETRASQALPSLIRHPVSYARFLLFLNQSARRLLQRYFKDPAIFRFFDKLTSTYCYTTVAESPAILAAVMFVDNHAGGSFYPAGSTVFLPGKLEKVIEEHGGDMLPGREVVKMLFEGDRPAGVLLQTGERIMAENIIYSGTVWNLYGKLIDPAWTTEKRRRWTASQIPTYPSVVLYARVDRHVIPADTLPVEMLVGNPDQLDESEVTAYLFSIDDRTLCDQDSHVVVAIGPSFITWPERNSDQYTRLKQQECDRLTGVLERRFPGFAAAVRYSEIATPRTIERYTLKNGGAVAGPRQSLGQHMFRRLHTRTEWDTLFCCGESTVMGTGTPTVTVTGLSAANAVLDKYRLPRYVWQKDMKNYVRIFDRPYLPEDRYADAAPEDRQIMLQASRCQYCERPSCMNGHLPDIRGIMRRVTVGNFTGASRLLPVNRLTDADLASGEQRCILQTQGQEPVAIRQVLEYLRAYIRVQMDKTDDQSGIDSANGHDEVGSLSGRDRIKKTSGQI